MPYASELVPLAAPAALATVMRRPVGRVEAEALSRAFPQTLLSG